MASKQLNLRHYFGGGFASDFGPSADVAPDAAGNVVFPYLIECENVFFELDGGPHKIGGTSKLNASVIESGEEIRGIFDFWRQGTAFSPSQQRVVYAGTKILADAANGSFSAIKTGLEDDKVPCFTVFEDDLIISSDSTSDVPMTYDGTTVSNLGGSAPQFSFSCVHKNHLWAAGVASTPSRLYYSRTLDANDWTHATSGSIDIDPNDGDRITAICSHKDNLWVFKGPYKGSIHRITGSANTGADSFNRIPFIEDGLGAVSHNTIFKFRDDMGFMWSDGTIHSLAATAAYGDFNESALSRPIHRYLKEHLNLMFLRRAWAASNTSKSIVAFCLPIDSGTHPNQILVMDFSRQQVWWTKWPALNACSIARVIDSANSNQHVLMIGGRDGYVRRTDVANRSIDSATAIAARVDTPYTNYGSGIDTKTLVHAAVGIAPKGSYTGRFGWTRDDQASQTSTFNQGGGVVLDQFQLDTDALGGAQYVDRFLQIEDGGEFRSISYQLYNSGLDEDLEVHSIATLLERGGRSMEATL